MLFILSIQQMPAQIMTTVIDETALQFRVKQIDEFFTRFNFETDYKGDKPLSDTIKEERVKNMLTLFNLDKYKNPKNEIDSVVYQLIDYVIDNETSIHYEDSTWYAEAFGSVVFEGKKQPFTYVLKPEQIEKMMYHWVISDVHSPLFSSFEDLQNGKITLSPAEHGVAFMSVPETLNLNADKVGTCFAKGYERNNLPIFDFLMFTKKLKVDPITKVIFHFKLGDYTFSVERIEKEQSYNQGWLINDIQLQKLQR